MDHHYDELFENLTGVPQDAEFEACTFRNCSWSSQDLSGLRFADCVFDTCDLSLGAFQNTGLREVHFIGSKLMGIRFDDANKLGLSLRFTSCQLNNSSFFEVNLNKTLFTNCQLIEVDFTGAQLTQALMDNCDLSGAQFEETDLTKADLSSSFHIALNPSLNRIQGLKIPASESRGLLQYLGVQVHD